jgi:hypothetical protein
MTVTLPRSLWTSMGIVAAASRIVSTMLRASAKASAGLNQPRLVATPAATAQHTQKPRRERICEVSGDMLTPSVELDGCLEAHLRRPIVSHSQATVMLQAQLAQTGGQDHHAYSESERCDFLNARHQRLCSLDAPARFAF